MCTYPVQVHVNVRVTDKYFHVHACILYCTSSCTCTCVGNRSSCYYTCTFCITIETAEQSQQRIQMLQDLGDCLVDQGQWHLAAKKFTQSGNRIKVHYTHTHTCTCTCMCSAIEFQDKFILLDF